MDTGSRRGLMGRSIKETGREERCMEMASCSSAKARVSLESSGLGYHGVLESVNGQTVTTMRVSTAKATSRGQVYSSAETKAGSMMASGSLDR